MKEQYKPYDNGSKRLLSVCAQDLLDWLVPGARFTGQFSEQFQSAELEADAMMETYNNDQREFVHFEFQSSYDADMAQRMLKYAILAWDRYQCSIRSYVLYLRPSGTPPETPLIRRYADGKLFLWFDYEVIEVWKRSHREALDHSTPGILPLVPLMQGGTRREVVEEIIERLEPPHDKISRELIDLTGLFAGLAFSSRQDKEWAKRRFAMLKDIFKDNFMHEFYKEEALKEARKEVAQQLKEVKQQLKAEAEQQIKAAEQQLKAEAEQMKKEAERMKAFVQQQLKAEAEQRMCQEWRQTLLTIVQARFPKLVSLAKTQVDQIKNIGVLEEMVGKVGAAKNAKSARQALQNWQQADSSDQ